MLEMTHLTKLYGSVIGVNDVNMTLSPGAYGILGPNGSGKSTLLNLITGQLVPTLGSIRVFGAPPRNRRDLFRRLGYCPGSEGMYAEVSALEWVAYLAQLHGLTRKEARSAATESLTLVGMQHAMTRPISTYSRGMRQRTKLAQALAHQPDLLILDEPFNGLDPIGRHEMTEVLRSWIEAGKSLLLASHILHEVESLTDAFLLISGGRLLASGTAEEVHALMVDVPTQIVLSCDQPRALAAELSRLEETAEIRFDDASGELFVATRSAGRLYDQLGPLILELGIHVEHMHSSTESLQSLFDSLMQIHRGER